MNKIIKSSRKRMENRAKGYIKQIPAMVSVESEGGTFKSVSNRKLRRKDAAQSRRLQRKVLYDHIG